MKKSAKLAVLSLVGVLALGGTATAIAFTIKAAKKDGSAALDKDYIELSFADREATFGNVEISDGASVFRTVNVTIDKTEAATGTFNLVYTYNAPSDVEIYVYSANPDTQKTQAEKPAAIATLKNGGETTCTVPVTLDTTTFTSYLEFACPRGAQSIGGQLNVKLEEAGK